MAAFDMNQISKEDRDQIKAILEQYRDEDGEKDPLLPLNVDIDGDGIVDAWGLDDNGEVELRSGAKLRKTVYVSEGDDVKVGP